MNRMKVLIIDDETDLCLLLKSYILSKYRDKYEVRISHSLADGLAHISSEIPDIIFLDNDLPDGTGWDKAPEIAREFPNVHINLISAFHPEIPKMPEKARYFVYEKPISLADLDQQFS